MTIVMNIMKVSPWSIYNRVPEEDQLLWQFVQRLAQEALLLHSTIYIEMRYENDHYKDQLGEQKITKKFW